MLPWLLCGVLALICIALSLKIRTMQKTMDSIRLDLSEWLDMDTNTVLSVMGRDRHIRALAAEINVQLRLLQRQRRRYEHGDRELKEAVTNISHDLRTPLTAICGYLALLEKEDASPEVRRYLDIITERAQALRTLTEELFRYSVIAAGQGLKLEEVDLVRALEEAAAASYTSLKEAGVEPEIYLAAAPVIRTLDRAAIGRVFGNILSNAAKYSSGDLIIRLSPEGVIEFMNTAPSLDNIQVGRLFDRFYTVESAGRSTGLGLSIAKTLVEQMNGAIDAKFENGKLTIRVLFL